MGFRYHILNGLRGGEEGRERQPLSGFYTTQRCWCIFQQDNLASLDWHTYNKRRSISLNWTGWLAGWLAGFACKSQIHPSKENSGEKKLCWGITVQKQRTGQTHPSAKQTSATHPLRWNGFQWLGCSIPAFYAGNLRHRDYVCPDQKAMSQMQPFGVSLIVGNIIFVWNVEFL